MLRWKWDGPSEKWIAGLDRIIGEVLKDATDRQMKAAEVVRKEAAIDCPSFGGDTARSLETRRSSPGSFVTQSAVGTWRTVPEGEDGNSLLFPFNLGLGLDQGIKSHAVNLYNPKTGRLRQKLAKWALQSRLYGPLMRAGPGARPPNITVWVHTDTKPTKFLSSRFEGLKTTAIPNVWQALQERW